MIQPDYIFETSWEVCNRVGGIYAVLSTRAASMQSEHPDHVVFFGPDLKAHSDAFFREDRRLLASWHKAHNQQPDMPRVRVGRWLVPGEPIVILLDYAHLWQKKDQLYAWAWQHYGVQSHAAYGDYDDSSLFGYAVGQVMHSLYNHLQAKSPTPLRCVAHSNEWQTAFTVFYLRAFCPKIGTLFTTHATGIGRSIAGNGKPLYDYFTGYNGDQMAAELNMVSKHSAEKQAAHHCHCFTTVSDLTARECKQLLDKQPDIVTPNGFELDFVPAEKDLSAARAKARQKLLQAARAICPMADFSGDPLLVAIAGRLEWKNKGIDVFLQAMQRLAGEPLQRPVIAFVLIPYLNEPSWHRGNVSVVFLPYYFPVGGNNLPNGLSPIAGSTYYELLVGMDMTIFPSYYEPWGYTPMESVAFRVPTVTTDLAGYGVWAQSMQPVATDRMQPVTVIHRTDSNTDEVVMRIIDSIRTLGVLPEKEKETLLKQTKQLADKATWKHFFAFYRRAYAIALRKC